MFNTKRHKTNSQMGQLMKRFTFMGCEIRQKFDGTRNSKKKKMYAYPAKFLDRPETKDNLQKKNTNEYCSRVLGTTFAFFLS